MNLNLRSKSIFFRLTSKLFLSLAILLSIPVCILIFIAGVLIWSQTNQQQPNDPVSYSYPKEVVLELCDLFNLSSDDDFCINSGEQKIDSLREMLYRHFPPNTTQHKDIVPLLSELNSRSERTCWDGANSPLVYAPDNCPIPEKCSTNYACVFVLPADTGGIQISFDKTTGLVGGYLVINPLDAVDYSG